MKIPLLFMLFLHSSFLLHANEFIYPVTSCGNTILIAYQKSLHQMQLWGHNYETGITEEVLGAYYMPLSVQLLPDKSGFSFIDRGRIRIKRFNQRSPKSIDLYKPLSNMTLLHWIDSRCCFLSARYKNRYQIFKMTIDGYVTSLVDQKYCDCLYPQKINNTLFYIERSKMCPLKCTARHHHYEYRIKQTEYEKPSANKKLIINFGSCAISFLTMCSESIGYVLEYPLDIPHQDKVIHLTCYRLEQGEGGGWSKHRILSFSIPLALIQGQESLAESLLPLLPKYYNDHIDFVHYHDDALNIFRLHFNDKNGSIEQLTFGNNEQYFFAPYCLKTMMVYGRSIQGPSAKVRLDRIIGKSWKK